MSVCLVLVLMEQLVWMILISMTASVLELKQKISESVGYPFEIYYPDSDPEPFRIVTNYFKQF